MTATEIKTQNKLTADEEAAPPQHLKVQAPSSGEQEYAPSNDLILDEDLSIML